MKRTAGERIAINQETRKRFVIMLLRVAGADGGITQAEWVFIRKFWR
jgi:uncharacterized tellurite resistance protein B-like protein